jgi:hypothetical protein
MILRHPFGSCRGAVKPVNHAEVITFVARGEAHTEKKCDYATGPRPLIQIRL